MYVTIRKQLATGLVKLIRTEKNEKEIRMKYMLVALLSLMFASTAFADGSVVRWNNVEGVITALNVDNPIADIHSGTFPWTTRSGHARVDLDTGVTRFDVRGLSINGAVFSGTPGPITAVTGTLVCDAGELDITFEPSGGGYGHLAVHAVTIQLLGHPVPVAAIDDVIASKTAAGRPKDLAALPALVRHRQRTRGSG